MGFAAWLACPLPGLAEEAAPSEPAPKWGAWVDAEGKFGTQRTLGETDFFLPLIQDEVTLSFANARFRFDDYGSLEGNLGLGLRRMLADGWNLGGYAYYDRRRSPNDNWFNQATLGLEVLGRDFDFRVNGYLPFGEKTKLVDRLSTAELVGTSVLFRGGEERALTGFDAEVGWRAPLFAADDPYELRLFAGGYRFSDGDLKPVQGPRLRAELTLYEVPYLYPGARLTLGGEFQTDEPRGDQGFGVLRLRFPLQPEREKDRTRQERRMAAPIVRDVDIVSQAGAFGAPEAATELADGGAFSVLSSGSTTGANLPGAVAAAGANSTVVLTGTFNTTAVTTLQAGQTLMGGGSFAVRSPSGRTATVTVPGATIAAATAGGPANPGVAMANNSTLTGMTVTNNTNAGTAAVGVRADAVNGVTISGNAITGAETGANTSMALLISGGSTGVVVSGNTLTGSGVAGQVAIGLNFVTSTATVTGNTISASGGTSNRHTVLNGATINAGSTGNVAGNGVCSAGGVNTGAIGYTDGSTCP